MKSLHLTIMLFCHVLLASLVFYFAASLANANVVPPQVVEKAAAAHHHHNHDHVEQSAPKQPISVPAIPVVSPLATLVKPVEVVHSQPASKLATAPVAVEKPHVVEQQQLKAKKDHQPTLEVLKPSVDEKQHESSKAKEEVKNLDAKSEISKIIKPTEAKNEPKHLETRKVESLEKLPQAEALQANISPDQQLNKQQKSELVARSQHSAQEEVGKASSQVIKEVEASLSASEKKFQPAAAALDPLAPIVPKKEEVHKVIKQIEEQHLKGRTSNLHKHYDADSSSAKAHHQSQPPIVNGGLGPLHLLATTLCSYQPDRPVADDAVNQLYARRAIVRKSLFDFMSLKFTNLEKLSSRLGYGLQVVPLKSLPDPMLVSSISGNGQPVVAPVASSAANKPAHGWPVVGKCTAHDLKLMGEAAWCECNEGDPDCNKSPSLSSQQVAATFGDPLLDASQVPAASAEKSIPPKEKTARSIGTIESFSPEQSSVISKILHVSNIKDAPVVESNFYNLNLTQHQLATLEAQATSTQECRRNALRYSKALFQHLSEDQQSRSESWPKLYSQISTDDCARKRMIDIVNALSGFRTDTTSIRRDNVEFAFAMDDLRPKVLENEVNVPLVFDRHFIEVEQFLQQSVRLMLASVQPKRAKVTSMRYRSLMYGATPSIDDQQQCIDLHQRLLAKNYPNDCNPTQFGQLPDVLRMTANSLELWSIEKELSLHLAKIADYPNIEPAEQHKIKEDVNECIANLVAS